MSNDHVDAPNPLAATAATTYEHDGASPQAPAAPIKPLTGWQKFKLVFKVVEVRLRFIAILVATAFFVGYWDSIKNHWHKETRSDGRVYSGVHAVLGERMTHWLWPHSAVRESTDSDTEFYCPMHPSVVRPGRDPNGAVPKCPICGMPLSQRKRGEVPKLPDGILSRKQYSPEQIQLAGIKTVPVSFQPLTKEISTVGFVAYDESRLTEITSRVSGYLEKVYVNKTWLTVKEGDPLAEIYSPDLASDVQVLLLNLKNKNEAMLESTKEKLRRQGIKDSELEEIVRTGKANHVLVLRSPQSGHIIRKEVKQGAHIEPGKTLFEVADLSAIWIEAEVFERDIQFLRLGQAIEATIEAFPNRVFKGKVSLVHPHLDPTTRTNGVRFDVENPNHDLRPGMFANVRIKTPLSEIEPFTMLANEGEVLAVPERAVVDTGAKKIVYIQREVGLFEGVEVELGPRSGEYYPVVKGLELGDRVAAAGAFLVDAETRLNPAAAATYIGASGGPQSQAGQGSNAEGRRPEQQQTKASGVREPPDKPAHARRLPAKIKPPTAEDLKNIAKLAPRDRDLATAQGVCPISDGPLGSMGVPYKVMVQGEPVFLCCKGCEDEVKKDPKKVLSKLAAQKSAGEGKSNFR